MLKKYFCFMVMSVSVASYAQTTNSNVMTLYVGQSEFIKDRSITNVAVGSDEVINALAIDNKGVLLTGIKKGDTTIKVWRDNSIQSINTHVYPANLPRMLEEINYFLRNYSGLSASIVGDTVLVEGDNVATEDKGKVDSFLAQYQHITNLTRSNTQVADKNDTRMVYFDVKIVEVSRSATQNLGIEWSTDIGGPQVGIIGEIKKSRPYRNDPQGLGLPGVPIGNPIRPFQTYAGLISSITSRINLLESAGTAKLIAHPVLSCRNGGNAEFLSGGQIPYTVGTATGTPSIAFKDYGIKLDVSPIIQNDGSILAQITSEISEMDPSIQILGVPGLLTRKTNTDFSLQNGETLVLSGLNYNRNSETEDKVPGLHKTPFFGRLFKNEEKVDSQTELLFIVTPFIYSENEKVADLTAKAAVMVEAINTDNVLLPEDFFRNTDNRVYFNDGAP